MECKSSLHYSLEGKDVCLVNPTFHFSLPQRRLWKILIHFSKESKKRGFSFYPFSVFLWGHQSYENHTPFQGIISFLFPFLVDALFSSTLEFLNNNTSSCQS